MRPYDPTLPLLVIHIPKAAGSSVKEIFKTWYGDALFDHYYDEEAGRLPPRRDLPALHSAQRPIAVYGHFNRLRGFGVEDYYPEAQQFVTILRDPFEAAISSYYYIRQTGSGWRDQSRVPKGDVRQFLLSTPPNMLNHFPRSVTKDNYRTQIETLFVHVGVMEHLASSVQRIAAKLGMPFDARWLSHLNATPRDQEYPSDLRAEYAERHALEFEVYEFAVARHLEGH